MNDNKHELNIINFVCIKDWKKIVSGECVILKPSHTGIYIVG